MTPAAVQHMTAQHLHLMMMLQLLQLLTDQNTAGGSSPTPPD